MSMSSSSRNYAPQFEALKKEVMASGISEITKEEMQADIGRGMGKITGGNSGFAGGLNDSSILQKVRQSFEAAKLGTDPKFKSRQATQFLFNTSVDQRDSSRLRGNMLNIGSSVRK